LFDDGKMIDLGTLPGGRDLSEALSINNRGQIVGDSGFPFFNNVPHAVLWTVARDKHDERKTRGDRD
jgi:hypothetical protein